MQLDAPRCNLLIISSTTPSNCKTMRVHLPLDNQVKMIRLVMGLCLIVIVGIY